MIVTVALHAISDDEENDAIGDGGNDCRRQLTDPIEAQGIVVSLDVAVDFRQRCGFDIVAACFTMKRLGSDDDSPNDGEKLGERGENRSGQHEYRDSIIAIGANWCDVVPAAIKVLFYSILEDDEVKKCCAEGDVEDGENQCADGATKVAFVSGNKHDDAAGDEKHATPPAGTKG